MHATTPTGCILEYKGVLFFRSFVSFFPGTFHDTTSLFVRTTDHLWLANAVFTRSAGSQRTAASLVGAIGGGEPLPIGTPVSSMACLAGRT